MVDNRKVLAAHEVWPELLEGVDDAICLFLDGCPAPLDGQQFLGPVDKRAFDAQVVQLAEDSIAGKVDLSWDGPSLYRWPGIL